MINVFDGNAVHSPVTSNYFFQIERWIWQQVTWVTREQRHQQVEDRGANCREMTTGLFATDSLSSLMSDYLHHLSRPRCPIQWILCGWGHPQSTTLPLNLNTESADLVLCFNISEAEKRKNTLFVLFLKSQKWQTQYRFSRRQRMNGLLGAPCWEQKRTISQRAAAGQLDNWRDERSIVHNYWEREPHWVLIGLGLGSNGCWSVISDRAWTAVKVHFCPLFFRPWQGINRSG